MDGSDPPSNAGPGTLYNCGLTYDGAISEVVLFGGYNGDATVSAGQSGSTWLLPNSNFPYEGSPEAESWVSGPSNGPPPRSAHAMVFDQSRSVVVLFGGNSGNGPLPDTWEFNGSQWNEISAGGAGSPAARDEVGIAYDTARQRVVLFGGESSSGTGSVPGTQSFGDTWEYE